MNETAATTTLVIWKAPLIIFKVCCDAIVQLRNNDTTSNYFAK